MPLGARYSAPCAARASISQDQPTRANSGSVTISGSTSARAKLTQRKVPCQAALPAGSCSSTSRPLPTSVPPDITSAAIAAENGAMRCGAGISLTTSSGRQVAVSRSRAARRNASGGTAGSEFAATRREYGRPPTGRRPTRRGRKPAPVYDFRVVEASSPFLAACRRSQLDERVPVWFMRQAGRSLPEYRTARAGLTMLESCVRPELVAEITLQPVRRYGVDAAILYSDIMVPLYAAGVDLDIVAGTGPVIARPIRAAEDLDQLRDLEPGEVDYVTRAVELAVRELRGLPLIGFAGAPFTLASYLVEGGPSRDYARTKTLMISAPELWERLCVRLADISARFLEVQIAAGVAAVQVFDSWAGALSRSDYERYAAPYSARLLGRVASSGVPRIHFGVGAGELLPAMAEAGADVVGVDWRVPLAEASRRIGDSYAVQGNLDPAYLSAPWPVLVERVRDVITSGAATPGHVFNLGHGVPPDADPDVLARIVDVVHAEGAELRAEARSPGEAGPSLADDTRGIPASRLVGS